MASELLEEAHKLHEELNHRVGMGHCLQGLGVIARLRGDLPYAGGLITRALELHQRVDNEFGVAQCKLRLSEVMIQEGKTNEARSTLEESLEEHERLGELLGVAHCINGLGTVARMTGDLSSARTLYTDADARFVRLGSIAALEPRKNLGLVALAQGSYGEGRQTLEAVAAAYVASGQTTESQAVSALLLAPLAALALWAPWDDRLVDAAQLKTEDGSVTAEVARWCQWGGQLAAEAGQQRRAQRAYDLAVHFFETVGARDLAAEVALAARALA
jgi:tetratricopeptide (TPR) repeat protein